MKPLFLVVALSFALAGAAAAAGVEQQLTIDQIFAQHPVSGDAPSGFTWAPSGQRYVYSMPATREKEPPVLFVHDVRTNRDRPVLAARSEKRGSRSRPVSQVVWSTDGSKLAFVNGDELDISSWDGSGRRAMTEGADDPQWSPDGTHVAYVLNGDLYTSDVRTQKATRLTFDGSETRLNGDPDWIYSEEMDVEHAYAFSPDGHSIAYLTYDDSPIAPYPIEHYRPPASTSEEQRYPLAGGKNPRVSLHVVPAEGGRSRLLYDGAPRDEYLVSFTWTPDSSTVVDEILDRAQQHLRLVAFPTNGASPRTLMQEHDSRFVEVSQPPSFLPDGKGFLWLSERGGVQALYSVNAAGSAKRLTGAYAVVSLLRLDARAHAAYVVAEYPTRRDRSLLRVALDGGGVRNLTPAPGTHGIIMAKNASAYIEVASSFSSPPVISRHDLQAGTAAVIFSPKDLSDFNLGETRALSIPSKWGPLDAQLTVPHDFDPTKRYPVLVTAYGGPLGVGGSTTNNRWQGLFPQLLAQHGILVFSVDGPASNDERLFYHSMGLIAMQGQLAGVDWLRQQPYVDAARLGLYGWSYGGYLTAFTMTHAPGVFHAGIAGGPPADWRFYDSAYTERYMGMPKASVRDYDRTSVLPKAGNLQGDLLLLAGSGDDNVHIMNTFSLAQAFISQGKHIDMFLYPEARHGVQGVAAQRDLYGRELAWWESELRPY
jgi:dipeptidyl-peptidase-4